MFNFYTFFSAYDLIIIFLKIEFVFLIFFLNTIVSIKLNYAVFNCCLRDQLWLQVYMFVRAPVLWLALPVVHHWSDYVLSTSPYITYIRHVVMTRCLYNTHNIPHITHSAHATYFPLILLESTAKTSSMYHPFKCALSSLAIYEIYTCCSIHPPSRNGNVRYVRYKHSLALTHLK